MAAAAAGAFFFSTAKVNKAKYPVFGVDVSNYQGDIDWIKVKNSGVEFVYIRMGYRGYTEGGINVDPFFLENLEGARSAGLQIGVYCKLQACILRPRGPENIAESRKPAGKAAESSSAYITRAISKKLIARLAHGTAVGIGNFPGGNCSQYGSVSIGKDTGARNVFVSEIAGPESTVFQIAVYIYAASENN